MKTRLNTVELIFFFFNDTATTEIYTLSLHDALPICRSSKSAWFPRSACGSTRRPRPKTAKSPRKSAARKSTSTTTPRSEEHTSELQSRQYLVCRLLLEKKKNSILTFILVSPQNDILK